MAGLVQNVSPALPALDTRHLLISDAVVSSDFKSCTRILADSADLSVGELGSLATSFRTADMYPGHASFDRSNVRPTNAVIFRDFFRCARVFADSRYLFSLQLIAACAFLLRHIKRVVFCRAHEQMIGIAARRIVAFVANAEALWNEAFGDFIDNPMRSSLSVIDRKNPVAKRTTAGPRPTSIGTTAPVHVCDKAFIHTFHPSKEEEVEQ